MDRREIAFAAPLPPPIRRGCPPRSSAPRDRPAPARDHQIEAVQWLPTIMRSGTRTCGVNSVTSASVPAGIWSASASIRKKPSACANEVIAPEPCRTDRDQAAIAFRQRHHDESVRPSSEAIRTGTLHDLRIGTRRQPAMRRSTGTIMS